MSRISQDSKIREFVFPDTLLRVDWDTIPNPTRQPVVGYYTSTNSSYILSQYGELLERSLNKRQSEAASAQSWVSLHSTGQLWEDAVPAFIISWIYEHVQIDNSF